MDLDALRPLRRFADVEQSLAACAERYCELQPLAALAATRCHAKGPSSSSLQGIPHGSSSSSTAFSLEVNRGSRAVQRSQQTLRALQSAGARLHEAQRRHGVCRCSSVGALKVLHHRSFQSAVDELSEELHEIEKNMDALRSFVDGVRTDAACLLTTI